MGCWCITSREYIRGAGSTTLRRLQFVRRLHSIKILMSDYIKANNNDDGIDRRGFLECMAWAGTGVVDTMAGGIAVSRMVSPARGAGVGGADFPLGQIRDRPSRFVK